MSTSISNAQKRPSDAMDTKDDPVQPDQAVHDIPNSLETRTKFINQETEKVIQRLALLSSKAKGLPDTSVGEAKELPARLEMYMRWLENDVEITPALKKRAPKVAAGIQLMYANPKYHFAEPMRQRAKALYEKWEGQNWGEGEAEEASSDDDTAVASGDDEPTSPAGKRRKSSATTSSSKRDSVVAEMRPSTIHPPPRNHPIFGEDGIMHGLVMKRSTKRKDFVLDQRYPKKDAKAFGHNGLEVGSWFAKQHIALFRGAHGSKIGGIAGNAQTGAYSIVVSGMYEELDQDQGDTLFYSGSRSHDNEDPKAPFPSSNATLAMKASLRNCKPVRVLRASGGKSRLSPTVGIRYDGLYRVVAMGEKLNTKGGKYEQFKLERLQDQGDLAAIARSRPTAAEVRDFGKIQDGY